MDTVVPAGPAPALRRITPSGQTVRVLALVAGLVAVALLIGRGLVGEVALLDHPELPWWAIAVAFAATEACVLHVQVNREARTVALSELPLVLGLFFTSPLHLVAGRLIGSAAVLVLHRRSAPLKTAFNLALVTAETCAAGAAFTAVVHWSSARALLAWAAAYGAVLLANVLSGVAVGLVIAVYEGGLRPLPLLRDAVTSQPAAPMVVTLALVAVTSLSASTDSAWLLLAFAALLLLAYRAYASLSDRHLNLERLYRFSQAVSNAPEVDGVLTSVLGEAKELLRSERASIAFVAAEGGGWPAWVWASATG